MARLILLTFYGQPRMRHEVEHHIHESPKSMTGSLVVLAICSVCAGWLGVPASLGGTNAFGKFLEPVFAREVAAAASDTPAEPLQPAGEEHRSLEWGLMILSVGAAVVGGGWGYRHYGTAGQDYR